jgi:hypothetical protein
MLIPPGVDSQDACSVQQANVHECAHKVSKPYCQDCLALGRWAATVKGLKLPSDAPKRAALCAIIPGMEPSTTTSIQSSHLFCSLGRPECNGEQGERHFRFGAFVFVIFTMFDSTGLRRLKLADVFKPADGEPPQQDRTIVGWGIFLILLGILFLQNIIPITSCEPVVASSFILLGAYLVYRAIQHRDKQARNSTGSLPGVKEDLICRASAWRSFNRRFCSDPYRRYFSDRKFLRSFFRMATDCPLLAGNTDCHRGAENL